MKKARLAVIITIATTLLAVLMSFLVPVPKGTTPTEFYFNLTISLATMLLYIGGSVVISMGFGAFTTKLRRAYSVIFTGLTLWALAYLQLPLLVILGLIHNDIAISFTVLPFIGSAICVFTGTRMLAKLFNVKTIATKWWFAVVVVVVIAALTVNAPHVPVPSKELTFDLANGLIMTAVTFFGLGASLIYLIKRQASVAYTNALAWLCISMATLSVFAGLGSTFTTLVATGDAAAELIIIVAIIPSCIAAALFLRSAYSFNKIAESADVQGLSVARNFFGKPLKPHPQAAPSSVDIVMYAAGLVSNPHEIDSQLEHVRNVTSLLQQGERLKERDEQTLMGVYLQIENYLTHNESVRLFTADTLRRDVAQKLRLTAGTMGTFWPKLGPIKEAA